MYSTRSRPVNVCIDVTLGLETQTQNLLYVWLLHGYNGYANAPLYLSDWTEHFGIYLNMKPTNAS
jgi:hypothetical protein